MVFYLHFLNQNHHNVAACQAPVIADPPARLLQFVFPVLVLGWNKGRYAQSKFNFIRFEADNVRMNSGVLRKSAVLHLKQKIIGKNWRASDSTFA